MNIITLTCGQVLYLITKPWLVGVFHKYATGVWGQRKFATDKPKPEGQGVYQWQISNDWGQGLYICGIHCTSCGSYDIYYGDITLGCRVDNITNKNSVLYLFIDTLFAPALADLKETMVSHVIDEFKFQQAIHKKEEFVPLWQYYCIDWSIKHDICGLFVTTEGEYGLWKGIVGLL